MSKPDTEDFATKALNQGQATSELLRPNHSLPHDIVRRSDGATDWGHFSKELEAQTDGEIEALPIRVFEGRHHGPNRGYGKIHIEAEHSKEFKSTGFERFVTDAVSTYTAIYVQADRIVVLFRDGKSRLQAVLERVIPAGGDACYSVVTVFRASPTKKVAGRLIWKK